jgi:hypothetical protein
MYENVLIETTFVENVYREYLTLINYYKNVRRPSIFARYLNINVDNSIYDVNLEGVFDRYNSGVKYDVYEYTPLYYASQVLNDSAANVDLKGQMFNGFLNVITYSILKPRVEDLIVFSYPPQGGNEIFRVSGVRTSINAIESTPNVNWNELTLEYAPLVDIMKLNLLNRYAYSLASEEYMLYDKFIDYIKTLEKLSSLFSQMQSYFDLSLEGYYYNDVIPLAENAIVYDFLSSMSKYAKYFETSKRPFVIKKYDNSGCIDLDGETETCPSVTVTSQTILDYSGNINIYDLAALVQKWNY